MLYEQDFLRELDESHEKITYAKIISLDLNESPLEQVEGRITTGSVNIDGNSAVRRTCSLTMVSKDMNINDYYWGLNTKFKLEIGVGNTVSYPGHYDAYPDIIWFKLGTYVITQINMSRSTNSYTINIQGKDKMCLLNGDVGGIINATTDFGTYDYYDTETGITSNYKLTIKQIIWDAVHAYANEPFHNIVINDLDELGLELLEYRYDDPLYLIRTYNDDVYRMSTNDGGMSIVDASDGSSTLDAITQYDNLTSSLLDSGLDATAFKLDDAEDSPLCCAAKISYGDTAGYRTCDLVYAGDLISNIGETVTSMLDKLKAMLGEFEYFYDLDGRFVFQRKKSLVNTVWTPQHKGEDNQLYVEALALASNSIYNFKGSILISSFQNNPNLLNLKNDFTVWGKRKGLSGQEIPIHMRYAIDNKPFRYVLYDQDIALTSLSQSEIQAMEDLKTREIITTDVEQQWKNFVKNSINDPLAYVDDISDGESYIADDPKFWVVNDWAEYYRILFSEYPGTRIPDDYMRTYCKSKVSVKVIYDTYRAKFPNARIDINGVTESNPNWDTYLNRETDTCVCRFYNYGGTMTIRLNPHGTCAHTFLQFVDLTAYVNGGFEIDTALTINNTTQDYHVRGLYEQIGTTNIERDRRGLYHVVCYCYDPKIPEDRKQSRLEELKVYREAVDPWEGKYQYNVDWRELIYRMAKDYRRHNHEDSFERNIALRNYPLYSFGKTGFEQYYTDLEGFWRQLYFYPLNQKEAKDQLEYQYTYYRDIEDKRDYDNIYIQEVYKPIGQKVGQVPVEKLNKSLYVFKIKENKYYLHNREKDPDVDPDDIRVFYIYNANLDRYYPIDKDIVYWKSENNGFTFTQLGEGSTLNFLNYTNLCYEGQIYKREWPSVTQLYINNGNNQMQKFLDTQDYTSGYYYQKINSTKDTQDFEYVKVTKETRPLTIDQKASLYYLDNLTEKETLEDLVLSLWEDLDLKQALFDVGDNDVTEEDLQQARLDLAQAKLDLNSLELNYIPVTDYFENIIKQQQNSINNYFVFDEDNLFRLSDINAKFGAAGTTVYLQNGEVRQYYESFILDNEGNRTITSMKKQLIFYIAYTDFYDSNGLHPYWNKNVYEAPQTLNFWFDFLEGDNELRQFSVPVAGDRPKAVNETNIKSIYYRDTPKVIFTTKEKLESEEQQKTGYNYFTLPDNSCYENMFTISAQGIDAKNRVDELLYQHAYCAESVTINSIPIYYLDVNKRIHVYDPESNINGDYVVSRLSIPLTYNGMMNITATKAPENSVTEREE